MKKILSVFLCIVLFLSLMPATSFAEDPQQYSITLSNYDNNKGEVTVNGSGEPPGAVRNYPQGTNVQIQIIPSGGFQVSDVKINDSSVGAITSHTIENINTNYTVEITFEPVPVSQYEITLSYNSSAGAIRINGAYEVPGNPVTVSPNPANIEIEAREGYKIVATTVGGLAYEVTNDSRYEFQVTLTENITIAADFAPRTYTITASAGENGTITPSGTITNVEHESNRQFHVVPNNGYEIDQVLVNGEPVGVHNRSDFTYDLQHIREDYTIQATFASIGDGSEHEISVEKVGSGSVTWEGMNPGDTVATVQDSFNITFTIAPDPGHGVSALTINGMDESWMLNNNGDGTFSCTLQMVLEDMTLGVNFTQATIDRLVGTSGKSYAVLEEEADNADAIKTALRREFGYLGYNIGSDSIIVSTIDTSGISESGYGTFNFTVTIDETPSLVQTGYIVPDRKDVIFKSEGTLNGDPIDPADKIRIAHTQDGDNGLFTAPAMDNGTIEIFGPYYIHMEGWMSPDVVDAFGQHDRITELKVEESFYRVQLHIVNGFDPFSGSPDEEYLLNWFGFDLIQDDAYCVKVDARSEGESQRTLQWDLNRYAVLNSGNYVSEVFFGNDTFEITIPEAGIGGITSLSLVTGDFQGYEVTATDPGSTYEVFFKSDFYDRIQLDVTINNTEVRTLTVHRVGVQIQKEIYNPDRGPEVNLLHGTQFGTRLDYSDGQNYRIYATYCIPDGGEVAPYGLYVTYTFANGSKTSRVITTPCNNPIGINAERFEDGVFIYGSHAACCDYLIYSAVNGVNAPVKVCVTVLKGNPEAGDTFEGIFFGSGAGVEWINES